MKNRTAGGPLMGALKGLGCTRSFSEDAVWRSKMRPMGAAGARAKTCARRSILLLM